MEARTVGGPIFLLSFTWLNPITNAHTKDVSHWHEPGQLKVPVNNDFCGADTAC